MKRISKIAALVSAAMGPGLIWAEDTEEQTLPAEDAALRVLMFTGGCCHDYDQQKVILSSGISERARVEWEIVHEGGTGTKHEYARLREKDWAKGFDVIVYNFCFSDVTDREYIEGITNTHREGLPAVALHCTYHSHHWKTDTDAWEEFLGATSPRHGRHAPITVTPLVPDHPVMKGFPENWTTPKGELYHVDKTWPEAIALAQGTIDEGRSSHACVWVNQFGKGRVFGTTLGHHNETMAEDVYLDLVTRGLLWAAGKLSDEGEPLSQARVEAAEESGNAAAESE
ncbi:MAG TPA: ThuA domain-containing protein [Verrucomicrobiales bacterium]|nr:ThuA domain-containing protein [Verrucomicrobiales bacterium]